MIFKKDNFVFGFILGMVAPFAGFAVFKYTKLAPLSYFEALQFLFVQPGYRMLTVAISLSLMANAISIILPAPTCQPPFLLFSTSMIVSIHLSSSASV